MIPARAIPKWSSPFRIVPIILALIIIGLGIYTAVGRSPSASKQEAKAAEALLNKCLKASGTYEGHPVYSTAPVVCSSAQAKVKVVAVLSATQGACPAHTTSMQLGYSGVTHPHRECLRQL